MSTGTDKSGSPTQPRTLVEIDEEECRALLETASVGRLAISTDQGPEIFPVNYGILDGAIAIWTAPGLKLDHASFSRVAFEVDQLDLDQRTAWVVEVKGHAEDITDAIDPSSIRLRDLSVHPWVSGPHPNCIAIARPKLTGRRLVP